MPFFTLTTSAHLSVRLFPSRHRVLALMRSVFSVQWGMARAAAVPVEALEAGDLMGETPRGKNARYAEPVERTPDQKAEEIVKKTLGSNLEKTMLEDLQRVVSRFFKPRQQTDPHEREIPEPCAPSPANSKGKMWRAGVKPFSISESRRA